MKYRIFSLILCLIVFPACKKSQPNVIQTGHSLTAFFKYDVSRGPMLSAHRGGPGPGFPENCIETFEHTMQNSCAMIECDIRMTRDKKFILMHDRTLDRTTTGNGAVIDRTLTDIQSLYLKDNQGFVTSCKAPTFGDALLWAINNSVLFADIRPEVPPDSAVAQIKGRHAEQCVVIVTYNANDAGKYFALDSTLMISCNIKQPDDYYRIIGYGVRPEKMIAFVGTAEPEISLYESLHRNGISCILGTMGNLDRKAETRGDRMYYEWMERGADIIATDRVRAVGDIIEEYNTDNGYTKRCANEIP